MDEYRKRKGSKVKNQSDVHGRRYRRMRPVKPAAQTLQQLLDTVVILTKMVKSAVDFYLYRHQPASPDYTHRKRAPVKKVCVNQKRRRTRYSSSPDSAQPPRLATSPEFAEPFAVALLPEWPTISSPPKQAPAKTMVTHVHNKRRRSLASNSSDSDDDSASCMDDDDTLTYVLLPGKRRGSQLMYVLDDKNLYVRQYSFQNYDRYVCKAPQCRCAVQLAKPAGVARRAGNRSATHRHEHMEGEYAEMTTKPIIDESTDDDNKRPRLSCVYRPPSQPAADTKEVFLKLTDCSKLMRTQDLPTPSTSDRNPAPSASDSQDIKSDIEVEDEDIWTEILDIEEGHEVSDFDDEFTRFRETYDETTTAGTSKRNDQSDAGGDDDENGDITQFEFVAGQRLHSKLLYTLHEKHLYRRASINPTYDWYVCISGDCRVCLHHYAKEHVLRRGKQRLKHNHPHAEEQYLANKFLNKVKQDILNSDGMVSTTKIYKKHAEHNAQIAKIVPLKKINSTLRRYRNDVRQRKFIESPDTVAGVVAAFQCETTFDAFGCSEFYRGTVVEATFGFSVFASATVVQYISQSPASDRYYHVDGSMNVLPVGEFKELLIVYWEHHRCIYPVVYALVTKRSRGAYSALFQFIEERICNLAPVSIMCDYECSLRNALHSVYPHCLRRPSHYNLVQAARRQALRWPQFFEPINADVTQYRVYCKLMHLPLLPPEHMAQGFELLRAESGTFGRRFRQFMDYVYMAWIEQPGGPLSVIGSESSSSKLVEAYAIGLRPKMRLARKFFHYVNELAKDEMQKAEQLKQLSADIGEADSNKPKFNRQWKNLVKLQWQLKEHKVTVAEYLQTLTMCSSKLNTTSDSAQSTEDLDDDDEDTVQETNLPLCDKCGAAEPQKIVLQPCGHVWKCRQCYEEKSGNIQIACPICKTIAKGHLVF